MSNDGRHFTPGQPGDSALPDCGRKVQLVPDPDPNPHMTRSRKDRTLQTLEAQKTRVQEEGVM